MRLLHTADLHLGLRRSGVSRWNDHMRVLEEILTLVEERQVDVLLFAGDVFNDRVDRDLEAIVADFLRKLLPILKRGIAVVLVSGNHDNRHLFRLMSTMLREIVGEDALPLLVCHKPDIYTLPGHHSLQIVALPYLPPNELREAEGFSNNVIEGSDLNQTLGATLELGLHWLSSKVDPDLPSVFVGHIQVKGSQAASGIELDYAHDISITPQSLPHYTQYNALGHIHLAQKVEGASTPSWYSGAPDRQDMGEREYEPKVLLVDLTMIPGEPCEPEIITVQSATPFVNQSLNGVEDVSDFIATTPSPTTLGRLQITCKTNDFADIRQRILSICPHLDVMCNPLETSDMDNIVLPDDPYDVKANVIKYLEEKFSGKKLDDLKEVFAELYGELSS